MVQFGFYEKQAETKPKFITHGWDEKNERLIRPTGPAGGHLAIRPGMCRTARELMVMLATLALAGLGVAGIIGGLIYWTVLLNF